MSARKSDKPINSFLTSVTSSPSKPSTYAFDQTTIFLNKKMNIGVISSLILVYLFAFLDIQSNHPEPFAFVVFYSSLGLSLIFQIIGIAKSQTVLSNYAISASIAAFVVQHFTLAVHYKFEHDSTENKMNFYFASIKEGCIDYEKFLAVVDILREEGHLKRSVAVKSLTSIYYMMITFMVLNSFNIIINGLFCLVLCGFYSILMIGNESIPENLNMLVLGTSIVVVSFSIKFYIHYLVTRYNADNWRLKQIKTFYYEWLLKINISYCLLKDSALQFTNQQFDKIFALSSEFMTEYKVNRTNCKDFEIGMTVEEVVGVLNKSKKVDFVKIAVISKEDSFFEWRVRKYSRGYIEMFFTDITQLVKGERQEIEEKYKKTVFAKIAHEFKTPIMNIVILAEKLKSKFPLAEAEELETMRGLGDYITFLVNDITNYFSDNKGLELVATKTSLNDLCQFCFNVLCSLIEVKASAKKQVDTVLSLGNDIVLIIDEVRVKQVVLNLLSNAAKFTVQGKITLSTVQQSEGVKLIVSDTGPGMDKKKLEQLRSKDDLCFQVRDEYNKMGSGLGISISKQICSAMGIELDIQSEEGCGTEISLFFKSVMPEQETDDSFATLPYNGPLIMPLQSERTNRDVVIVAEDNLLLRRAMKSLVEKISSEFSKNWEVLEVEDGIFALSEAVTCTLKGCRVAFLLTDEYMDYLNGSDCAQILLEMMVNSKIAKFSCISCSAFEHEEYKDKIKQAGITKILDKPATKASLIAALKDEGVL